MSSEEKHRIFNEHKIKFENFDSNPYNVLFSDNLSFRIKEEIVESKIAIPQIISLLAFNKEISQDGLGTILDTKFLPLNNSTRSLSKIPQSNIGFQKNKKRCPSCKTEKKSNKNAKNTPTRSQYPLADETENGKKPYNF